MQPITVIAMGKLSGYCAAGVAQFQKRLHTLCRFEIIELPEQKLSEKNLTQAQIHAALEKEGAHILAAMPKASTLVALCVEGKNYTSEAFAKFLCDTAQSGSPSLTFAIGSSHGLGQNVKTAATHKLCLSSMTLPHALARVVLCEQIYRALMINANTKYHK